LNNKKLSHHRLQGFITQIDRLFVYIAPKYVHGFKIGVCLMALSAHLETAGLKAEETNTTATAKMEKVDVGWEVTAVYLDVNAHIPPGYDKYDLPRVPLIRGIITLT